MLLFKFIPIIWDKVMENFQSTDMKKDTYLHLRIVGQIAKRRLSAKVNQLL